LNFSFQENVMTQNIGSLVDTDGRRPISSVANVVAWVLQILVAIAFLGAGSAKLGGAAPMVAVFAKVGIGQWFRFVTGTLEVGGAVGLLWPRTSFYAASVLAVVMVGAITAHLTVLGGNPTPPIILLVLSATIAYLRRPARIASPQ
jgi:putative oxidoreductase